jgi:ATP synthase protein I
MNDGRDEDSFERRLAAARDKAAVGSAKSGGSHKAVGSGQRAFNLAMRLGVELVAAMVIAVVIGWGLDKLLHTSPWLMIAMVPVGMAAGLRNLVRAGGPGTGGNGA